jgi:hypothetical protein
VCKAGKETGPRFVAKARSCFVCEALRVSSISRPPFSYPKAEVWFTTQLISLLGRKQMYSKVEVCFMVILGSDHFMASEFEAIYLER